MLYSKKGSDVMSFPAASAVNPLHGASVLQHGKAALVLLEYTFGGDD